MAGRLQTNVEVFKITKYEVVWHKIRQTQCILLEYRWKRIYCDAEYTSVIYKREEQDTWSCEVVTPGLKLDRLKAFIELSNWKEHEARENYYTHKKLTVIRQF